MPKTYAASPANMVQIADGRFRGFAQIETDDYNNADMYVRNSHLNAMRRSPRHAKYALENPSVSTPAMAIGTALHCALLEPAEFNQRYCLRPQVDGRTKEGKQLLAEFKENNDGKAILSREDFALVTEMADSVMASKEAVSLLFGGFTELSAFWQEDKTGVLCKARFDKLNIEKRYILDVKTTQDCSRQAFAKSIANFGYARQAAFYAQGASYCTGQDFDDFIFLAIEKEPPYEFAIYRLDYASLERGRDEIFESLVKFKHCIDSGVWPGYERKIEPIGLPTWALKDAYNGEVA